MYREVSWQYGQKELVESVGLRQTVARTNETLPQAISDALATVTKEQAKDFFRHGGEESQG